MVDYVWSGEGAYETAPVIALNIELNGLVASSGNVLALSSTIFSNASGYMLADFHFEAGTGFTPAAGGFLAVWLLRSIDGSTFEDGSASLAPARDPDALLELTVGAAGVVRAGDAGIPLPPGAYKIILRNQTSGTLPSTGNVLSMGLYTPAAQASSGTPQVGDKSGFIASRIADMMDGFGVGTYSQIDIATNIWGTYPSNYTTASVIPALQWLTSGSGMRCNIREYHFAGNELEAGGAGQASWCPAVCAATGARVTMAVGPGGTSADVPTMAAMALSSSTTTGWLEYLEGNNEPNNSPPFEVTTTVAVASQQAVYAAVTPTYTNRYPVQAIGPSLIVSWLPPDIGALTGYFSAPEKANVIAAMSYGNVHHYPSHNPEWDDGSGRAGEVDDMYIGHSLYYDKPLMITEWHPTLYQSDISIIHDDTYIAYYAALFILNAFRVGYQKYYWWALFDWRDSSDSGWMKVGLWANSFSDTPRPVAHVLRAMYRLTGDIGAAKRTFTPTRLDYQITGLPEPVGYSSPNTGGQHKLFENTAGLFFLYVWNEQTVPGGSTVSVTVTLRSAAAILTRYNLTADPANNETPAQTLTNATVCTFDLAAEVHLLVIDPLGRGRPAESADASQLTTTSGTITDASAVAWSLVQSATQGLQLRHGASTDGANAVLVYYHLHSVYYENTSGAWFVWSGSAFTATTDPRESAQGSLLTSTAGAIIDAAGVTWRLVTSATQGLRIQHGAATDGANAALLLYWNHTLYYETTANVWSRWSGTAWVVVAADPRATGPNVPTGLGVIGSPTTSSITVGVSLPTTGPTLDRGAVQFQYKAAASGTWLTGPSVPYATPGQGSITDAQGHVWAVTAGGVITRDGVVDPPTQAVTMIQLFGGTLWQVNSTPLWYGEDTATMLGWTAGQTIAPLSAAGTGVTIGGLAASTPYDFQALISNSGGTSAASAGTSASTAAIVSGNAPGAPTAFQVLGSPGSTSFVLTWAPPVTGGVINDGGYQVQYKAAASGTWLNGPAVRVITPGVGTFNDVDGRAWTVTAGGQLAINGVIDGVTANVTQAVYVNSTVWQVNSFGNWYSKVHQTDAWSGAQSVSPLAATGVTITGLIATTPYNARIYAYNTSGIGAYATLNAMTSGGSVLAGDAVGTTARRIADMMEIFGANVYPNGQDGAINVGTNYTAAAHSIGISYIVGSSGMGMFFRVYTAGAAWDGPFIQTICTSFPGSRFTSCVAWDLSSAQGVVDTINYGSIAASGFLLVEGANEPNEQGLSVYGTWPTDLCLQAQQQIYAAAHPRGVTVIMPSVTDHGSNTYVSDYYGGTFATQLANADWSNAHDYPNSGSPNADMARRSDMVQSMTGKPPVMTEFHPMLYNDGATKFLGETVAAYYASIALLSGYLDHNLRGLHWFSWYDYNNFGTVFSPVTGLFHGFDPSSPTDSARIFRAMFQLTGDPNFSSRHNFNPSNLAYSISPVLPSGFNQWSGGRHALFQNSAGRFFLYIWNEQYRPGGTAVSTTVTFSAARTRIRRYNITASPSTNTNVLQDVSGVNSITFGLAAEVHLIVVDY